ncbi:hypothetical protein EST38_g14390 [Candolleomyces aberdarensis]|uniref:HPP transmembrane region domain-containing protein n=1 Tax=Candolleomyces aberdarensis TaxID=2316362 RepID=A0A4Q2D033_9AGAR|nr:hypothetical protein EST38_g14390 [Candolleomyces aberdarensis]
MTLLVTLKPITSPPINGSSPESSGTTAEKPPTPLHSPKSPDTEAQLPKSKLSRLARLPTWISFWLGYRKDGPPPGTPQEYVIWFWSFFGAFASISLIQALFGNVSYFVERGVPSIGATAILLYGAIESPLAQPRPVIGGHLVGAFVGVGITKLFLLLPTQQLFDELSWLAGSLCCAIALVVMQMTGTTHPPAGATALIAVVSPDIRNIGWLYLPVVLLAASIAVVVALLCNNMHGRYPTFWWTLPPTPKTPSVFPTLPLSQILERGSTWTSSTLQTLTDFMGQQHAQQTVDVSKLERGELERNDRELARTKQDAFSKDDPREDIDEAGERDLADCEVVIQRSNENRAGDMV